MENYTKIKLNSEHYDDKTGVKEVIQVEVSTNDGLASTEALALRMWKETKRRD